VLRRERLDVFSAVVVRFSKRVLIALGREQDARLGKRDPSPLVRWQCRQGAGKCGRGCSVELHGIGGSGSVCPKSPSHYPHLRTIALPRRLAPEQAQPPLRPPVPPRYRIRPAAPVASRGVIRRQRSSRFLIFSTPTY